MEKLKELLFREMRETEKNWYRARNKSEDQDFFATVYKHKVYALSAIIAECCPGDEYEEWKREIYMEEEAERLVKECD